MFVKFIQKYTIPSVLVFWVSYIHKLKKKKKKDNSNNQNWTLNLIIS